MSKQLTDRPTKQKYLDYQMAFQHDCETLLRRYLQHATFSFEVFTQIWNEIKFGLVYLGKYRKYEIGHFTELLLHCTKKYLIHPKCRFTQIGGLYLLYSLYFKQPIKNLVKIRLLSNELETIKELISIMKKEKRLEALYIFKLLLEADAFDFVASQYQFYVEGKCVPPDLQLTNNIFPQDGAQVYFDFQHETEVALENIKVLDEEFNRNMAAFKATNNVPVFDCDSIDIVQELQDILKETREADNDASQQMAPVRDEVKHNVEDCRELSDKRRNLISSSFGTDTRTKYLLQRFGNRSSDTGKTK